MNPLDVLSSAAAREAARTAPGAARSAAASAPAGGTPAIEPTGSDADFATLLAGFLGTTPQPPRPASAALSYLAGADSGETAAAAADPSVDGEIAATSVAGAANPPGVAPVGPRMNSEFTTKLERAIRRMRDEFGHEVRIVEGWRSQDRQDALHAQGRTAPGPVVTWTRHSQHTLGRAADVIIDGTYDNPAGYKRLARIAAEEGLRTLGPKDPGHIELAGGTRTAGAQHYMATEPHGASPAAPRPAGAIASPAAVAAVAQVAAVAAAGGTAAAADSRPRRAPADNAAPDFEPLRPPVLARADAPFSTGTGDAVPATATAAGPSAAQRAAQILDALAARDAAPSSSMLFRLDDAGGSVRLGMRGNAVHAAIVTSEPGLAADLGRNLQQLRDALAAHGLDAERLSVRSATPAAGTLRAEPAEALAAGLARAVEPGTASGTARQQQDPDQPRRQPEPEHRQPPERDPRSRREQQRKEP